jgi:hypothetical protein
VYHRKESGKIRAPLRAIILERNRLLGRRIARIWASTGLDPVCVEDPAEVPAALPGAALLAADVFDVDLVRACLRERPELRAAVWTAEPLERALRVVADEPRVAHIFGRPSFETSPRDWELALFARRMTRTDGVPFGAFLAWGHSGYKEMVATTAQLDAATANVARFVDHLGLPKRVGEMFGELAHELIMNALYDAPADGGTARHAHDRKSAVRLAASEAATVRMGCDGTRLVLQVVDPFGRLERRHVFAGVLNGLRGHMDPSRGGAGLGLALCANATVALVFDVVPGTHTSATGLFDLDLNLREFRSQAKSLHFFGDR